MDDFEAFLQQQSGQALTPPAQAPDPFADFLRKAKGAQDTQQQAQAVVMSNMGASPDAAGRAAQVGKQIGMPQGAVETDLPHYEAQAQAQKNSAMLTENPVLAQWVAANPDAARIAGDDLHNLKSVADSLKNVPMAYAQKLGEGFSKGALSVNTAIGWLSGQSSSDSWWYRNMVAPRLQAQQAYELDKNAGLPEKIAGTLGSATSMFSQIALSGGTAEAPAAINTGATALQNIGAQALHGVRAMLEPALVDAVDTGRKVLDATGDQAKAFEAAQAQFAATTMMGMVPLSVPGGIVKRVVSGAAYGGVSSEVTRQGMNLVMPDPLKQPFDAENILLGSITGGLMGGVMGPRGANGPAQGGTESIKPLLDAAAKSKLRERAPDAFHQFVTEANKDGPVQGVFIDAHQLVDALAQSKVNAQEFGDKIPAIGEQLPEAMAVGGDVKIPLADLATHLPGSGLEDALLPHLRTSQGAMSEAEAAAHGEGAPERLQADLQRTEAAYKSEQPLRDVFNDVYGQLLAAGKDPTTASREALLWRERLAARAERLGMDPLALYQENPLKVRRELGDVKTNEGAPLQQDEKRGLFLPESNTVLLLKDANFSTFLHESGHSWLEDLRTDAARENAPQQVKDDWNAVKAWSGIKDDTTIPRESHEQFARAVEAYVREGKAPSNALKEVFARFKDWLVRIYRNASSLNVHMTDEVRGVMDRLLASDDAIAEARKVQALDVPLLDKAGMTEAEYTAYAKQFHAAQEEAKEQMRNKVMRELDRENRAWWKDERATMRAGVEKEVNAQPVYRAMHWLQKGEFPDGSKMEGLEPVKLSKTDLVNSYGEGILKQFSSPFLYSAEGGVHPDLISERLGFGTGAELVKALTAAKPRVKSIEAETNRRMSEKFGNTLDDGTLPDKAMMAVHNDRQADVYQTEMKILRRRGAQGEMTPIDTMKAIARDVIGRKAVGDLDPGYYARAEAKAAREAETALLGKDMKMGLARNLDDAYAAKQRQMLNHFLYREAQAQADAIEKGLKYQRKFDKASIRDRLPGEFVEQIDGLRDQYDFKRVPSDPNAKQKQALSAWAEGQREAGFEPDISDWLAQFQERIAYRDLTVEQFNSVVNGIKSIEHIAREQKVITVEGKRRDLDAVVQELLVPLRERGEKFTQEELLQPPEPGVDSAVKVALHRAGTWLRLANADLKPQEFRRNQYDMQQLFGPFGKYLFDRMFERNYWKTDQLKKISDAFGVVAKELGRDWQKSLYDLVPNKTLMDPDLSKPGEAVAMKLTRARMLGIARHVGNESNFDKLTRGMGWKPEDVWSFLHENMSAKDWQATQAQWDIFERYWPEIEGLAKRLGGVPPEKIPLRPFDTKFGAMRGGYAPIDYDPLRSKLGAKFGEILLQPNERITDPPAYRATTTFNGSMVNRSEGYADRINLDFHSVEGRLRDTIHDLAYREALIDANKIIRHPEFKGQFMRTFGREEYAALQKWLLGIKGMQAGEDNIRGFEKALQYTRTGVIMTGIAYRLSTVLVHGGSAGLKSLGYFGDGAGAKYFASRVGRMASGNARADIADASEKFPEIRTRLLQMDRDYKEGSHSMYEPEGWRAKNDRFGHMMVAWSDALTAVPTAWAAYDRAINEGVPLEQGGTGKPMAEADAVKYANKVVREAHGTALESNRSLFMQSRGLKGLFGTIYGFMNNTYGQLGDMVDKSVASGHYQDKPALLARALGILIIPALWTAYIKRGSPDDAQEPWWEWAGMAITGEAAATVPFARDAMSMVEYKNASSEVAPIRVIHDAVKVGQDVAREFEGEDSKIIQDAANSLGELLHIGGLGQAGKTAQYLRELHEGKQNPESAVQLAQGAVLGNKEKH